MSEFWLVAGAGHCGTQWLSRVVDAVPGWKGYHELRHSLVGMAWHNSAGFPADVDIHSEYWDKMKEELQQDNILDSNSWAPFEIPLVNAIRHVDRVIYLVRNGIQQLHSLKNKSHVWAKQPRDSYAYDVWLRQWWRVGNPGQLWPRENYDRMTRFERLCVFIQAHTFAPDWLRAKGLPVEVYRLEDLTTDVDVLQQVANLPAEVLRGWQRADINRKVDGDRTPATLWNSWTEAERDTFLYLCTRAMRQYSYEVPAGNGDGAEKQAQEEIADAVGHLS